MGIVQIPYKRKPEFGRLILNPSEPLTKNLAWCVFPGGSQRHDLVSGAYGQALPSGGWSGALDFGSALTSTSATNGGAYWIANDQRIRSITRDFSIAVYLRETSTSTLNRSVLSIPLSSATTTDYAIRLRSDTAAANSGVLEFWDGTTLRPVTRANVFGTGPSRLVTAVRSGGTGLFYRDGTFVGSAAFFNNSTANVTWGSTIEPITLFNRSSSQNGDGHPAGLVGFAALWNIALLRRDAARLSENPAILLRPQAIVLNVADAGGGIPQLLQAAIAGTSNQSGVLTTQKNLGTTIAGTSTQSGSLSLQKNLSSTVASSSTATGVLSLAKNLASAIAGTSSASGSLAVEKKLGAAIAGSSTQSGGLTTQKNLSASISGTSAVAGGLTIASGFSLAIAGTSTAAGALTTPKNLSAIATGTSAQSGGLTVGKSLAASISGTSTASATLTIASSFQAAIAGISSAAGALTVQKNLGTAIGATSAFIGNLTVDQSRFQVAIAAISQVSASIRVEKLLQSTLASNSAVGGDLTIGVIETPPGRTIQVVGQDRGVLVMARDRTVVAGKRDRNIF